MLPAESVVPKADAPSGIALARRRPEGLWLDYALSPSATPAPAPSGPSRAQALLTWREERQVLRRWGLQDAAAILDLGCGPGQVSAELLSEAPAATLVGVDLDGDALRLAVGLTAADAGRRCLVRADAHSLPFADASFDFVHARVVFQYLRRPSPVAREAFRVLQPGGRIVVRHLAHSYSVRPPLEGLDRLMSLYEALPPQQGWDRGVESRLRYVLREAGAARVEERSLTSKSQLHEVEVYLDVLMGPRKRAALLESRAASAEEIETFVRGKSRWLENPNKAVLLHFRMVCGLK